MPPTSRGALIVIEGLDRAGKSTQHAALCSHLESQGHSVKRLRFPDRTTPIGTTISSYLTNTNPTTTPLNDHAIHLLFSANRWELRSAILAAVESGTHVIVDRYYYSGIVYSAAKGVEGLDVKWARGPEVGLPKPDLVVFLDVGVEVAQGRGGYGGERYEEVGMQGRVREVFGEVLREEGKGVRTRVVDAGRGVEEVGGLVRRVVEEVIAGGKLGGRLGVIEG